MTLKDEIRSLSMKAVAARKAADELTREVEKLKTKALRPPPRVRQNKKADRVQKFANFYYKRKIKSI